ncbi:glycosyltransferase 61 family protein [Thiolapillus sp.]
MPDPGFQLFPASAGKRWREHSWHREIADFQLPEKELLSLPSACITASRHLGPEQAQGGVYSARGEYVSSSRHLRRNKDLTGGNPETIAPPGDIPRLSGRYLYLGWFFNHYGHFVLESLCRAWALDEAGPVDGYLMHLHAPDARPADYLLAFFDLLAVPREKLIFVGQDMQVSELLLPSQQGVLSRGISGEMLALYRQLGSRAAKRKGDRQGDRLYISRRFLPSDQRGASNEKVLEDRFRAQGYQVVHPQFLDVTTQLALFANARDFAGLEGSGLHNILFARAPRRVWMLGAEDQLADAITQVHLGRLCRCATELHLQRVPEFSGLHPRMTPFLVNPQGNDHACLSGIEPAAYDRFLWLSALAAQLNRKGCDPVHAEDGQLCGEEAELLRLLRRPSATGVPSNGVESSNELFVFWRAEREYAQGNAAAAIEHMAQCLPEYETHAAFLHRYAQMLLAGGRNEQAREIAARALGLDPENPDLARFHAGLESVESRLARLRGLVEVFPRFVPGRIQLAEALAEAGSFDEAADVLEAVIHDLPEHRSLLPRLTWYLYRSAQYEAAEKTAREALSHAPDNPFSFVHLCRIHLARKEPAVALGWIDRAIVQAPEKKELLQLREKILEILGKKPG